MNLPLVSVIIRTNSVRRGCLMEAMDSVLSQSYLNIELVIVENGSSELGSWLSNYNFEDASRKVSYYQLDDYDRCIAGNYGLEQAKGEYLCFLDDDDLLYSEHIKILVKALKQSKEAVAAYSIAEELPCEIISYTPFKYKEGMKRHSFQREFSRGALFVNNNLPIQSVLFKKSLYETYGGFDRELDRLEDWNLWVRYASEKDFIFVSEITSLYRIPYGLKQIIKRDKELDEYYPQARNKQKDIATFLDKKLLSEIINEMFRPSMLSSFVYSNFSGKMIEQSNVYNLFCSEHEVDLSVQAYPANVLETIELANKIVIENKFLWFLQRTEYKVKQTLKLSTLKRIWLRS